MTKNITSKGNPQDQFDGLILIMSGYEKISRHMNHISIKTLPNNYQRSWYKNISIIFSTNWKCKNNRKHSVSPRTPSAKISQKFV